jgi:UDP-N-acetylmuramoylalanine--D-glutamate ligase
MKIAILGYDTEGRASYDYFAAQGHDVTICDQKADLQVPDGAKAVLGDSYLANLDRFDLLVRTPGMHPKKILETNPGVEAKITSQTNEFLKASPTKKIIGVTGTKGKGTTSTLITKMLETDGKQVFLGGNIGVPPLSFISELSPDSWVVLELSSFQLFDLQSSPHIALCLMVVPEHLDWHADTDEYYTAKTQLFRHQTADDFAIYNSRDENSKRIASTGQGWKVPYMERPGAYVEDEQIAIDDQTVCSVHALKLLGQHNWQNVCAAVTAFWKVSQNLDAVRQVLTTFSGLEHRLEFVRELNDVKYYDDSFGTTPETAIVAIQAFEQPKVVILGGSDKGASYDKLAKVVAENNVRHAITIGKTGPEIAAALVRAGYNNGMSGGNTMEEIVKEAAMLAEPGDIVLLSTGCASFGLFKNYKDRGEQFKQAVQALV